MSVRALHIIVWVWSLPVCVTIIVDVIQHDVLAYYCSWLSCMMSWEVLKSFRRIYALAISIFYFVWLGFGGRMPVWLPRRRWVEGILVCTPWWRWRGFSCTRRDGGRVNVCVHKIWSGLWRGFSVPWLRLPLSFILLRVSGRLVIPASLLMTKPRTTVRVVVGFQILFSDSFWCV